MAERGAGIAAAAPAGQAGEAGRGPPSGSAGTGPPSTEPASTGSAANWRQTLWAMVAIQFVTAMANSVLTPIMPLFLPELGVDSPSDDAIWAGILAAARRLSPPLPRRSGAGCPTGTAAR